MRGFLGGISLGAAVAVSGAALLSLSAPLPKTVDVTVQTPSETSDPVVQTGLPAATPGPDSDLVEAAPVALENESTDSLSGLQDVDTEPGSQPVVSAQETVLSDPEPAQIPDGPSTGIAPQTESRVVSGDSVSVPTAPLQETEVVVSSEPAQPPVSEEVAELAKLDPQAPPPDIAVQGAESTGVPPSSARGPDIASSPDAEIPPVAPKTPEASPVVTPNVVVDVPTIEAPEAGTMPVDTVPSIADAPAEQWVPGEARETADNSAEGQEEPGDRIAALPTTAGGQTGSDGLTIGTPIKPLTDRNKSETSDGFSAQAVASPFQAHAEPFDNVDGRPIMSIVLIDDTQSIGAEALVGFPYPLSFAIDPEDPKAAKKMAERRAAGFEVLILTDLPREAAPQDAETALAVWFDTLPKSVGVLEGTNTGFQGNRPLADQVSAVVAASGRGMVTQNHGLNTVQKLAARDGVPASVVFRDFDGAGQDPKAIRRFLDQAAFRAGQEGSVIMLGRVRPDTISALLLWGLQDRAARVSLAPVSVALSSQFDNQ